MKNALGQLIGTVKWTPSQHGACGWCTGMAASSDGSRVMVWTDVCQAYARDREAVKWTPIIRPGFVPADLIDYNGLVPGGYHGAFGGNSNQRAYLVVKDRLLRSDDGAINWANTSITGLSVGSNDGNARIYMKGDADAANQDVYYASMGQHGVRRTIDGGVTNSTVAGLPLPTTPATALQRWTSVKCEVGGAQVGGRAGRVAFAPSGQGVWLTTDGGETATQISATLLEVSDMLWHGGALFVVCITGDPGLHSWTQAGGWFKHTNLPTASGVRFIVKDPRQANAMFLVYDTNNFAWTANLPNNANAASWVQWLGGGSGTPQQTSITMQTRPRTRPVVARNYRRGGGSFAASRPLTAGDWLFFPIGYGVLRTSISAFPTTGAGFSDYHVGAGRAKWPTWQEDCAGIEELVGMSCLWAGDNLHLLSQDKMLIRYPRERDGHGQTSYEYFSPALTNGTGASHGVDPNFIAAVAWKNGPIASYSLDGKKFTKCVNQPTSGNLPNCGGLALAGAPGVIMTFPTHLGRPQYTDDLGATPWKNLRFFLENGTELDFGLPYTDQHGFHGAPYYVNQHLACLDPVTGALYVHNMGATTSSANSAFTADNLGWGGLYRCLPGAFPNFTRVIAGNLTPYGNYGTFGTKLLATGQGQLIVKPNRTTPPPNATNYSKVVDLQTMAVRNITCVRNIMTLALGAPLPGSTTPALWMIGEREGTQEYGLWLSLDLGLTVANAVSFPFKPDGGGSIGYIDAHKGQFGLLAAAVNSRGHAIGEYVMEFS